MIVKNNQVDTIKFCDSSESYPFYTTKYNDKETKNFYGIDFKNKFYYFDINKLPHFSANKNKQLKDKATSILAQMSVKEFESFLESNTKKNDYQINTKELLDKFVRADNYDIFALLEMFGFHLNVKSSPKNAVQMMDSKSAKNVVFKHEHSDEILLVRNINNVFYFKNNYRTFDGNVYNLINHYKFNAQDYKNPNLFIQAHEFLKDFSGQNYMRPTIKIPETSASNEYVKGSTKTLLSSPLKFALYLVSRGILPSTLMHPTLYNTMYNTYYQENPYFQNISFLLKNSEFKNLSYIEKNLDYQSFKENVSTDGLLYVNNFKDPKELIFSETPIDLISFAQMYHKINEQTILTSSAGNINTEQLHFLAQLIEKNDIKSLTICNDNDVAGHRFDYNILSYLAEKLNVLDEKSVIHKELYLKDTRNISISLYKDFCDHLIARLSLANIEIHIAKPDGLHKDFNQVLCADKKISDILTSTNNSIPLHTLLKLEKEHGNKLFDNLLNEQLLYKKKNKLTL